MSEARGRARTLASVLGLWIAGSASAGPALRPEAGPGGCIPIGPGMPVQAALDAAAPGGAVCLLPGEHAGPLHIGAGVTLHGPPSAVVRSSGAGSTITLAGDGARLRGISVDGSGGRFDQLDAAVRVEADRARVEGVHVRDALFGILAERCREITLADNVVEGHPGKALGLRGDAIRIWEVRASLIARNRIRDGRDLVIWYSPGNRIVGNDVVRGRYGTHLMYSHDNEIVGNRYVSNVVGIFAMYSRGLRIRQNLLAESGGAAGVGIGAKESEDLEVVENWMVGNTTGIYLDTSPLDLSRENVFRRNVLRLGEVGVVFHGRADGNQFLDNAFLDNHVPVRVEGRGDATGARWRGNAFDGYAGFDLDGDGTGDLPYELRSLSGELVARVPRLAFLRGTASMALLELVGRVVPLFEPRTLLVDPAPRMRAVEVPRPRAPDAESRRAG